MSDAETNVLDYLRTQFARMDNRFDSIERKLDELLAMLPLVERQGHDQNLDIVLLRLLARVKALEERE